MKELKKEQRKFLIWVMDYVENFPKKNDTVVMYDDMNDKMDSCTISEICSIVLEEDGYYEEEKGSLNYIREVYERAYNDTIRYK